MAAKSKIFNTLSSHVLWSPELALEELRRFHKFYGTASSEAVQQRYMRLYKAFWRNKNRPGWFSDWDDFVNAAKVDKNLAHTFWTKEEYLSVLQAHFTKHPDSTTKEFELANPDAYTAYKRHKGEWGLESTEKELIKLKLRTAKPAPEPKPPKPAKPPKRKRLPKITVDGEAWDAEKILKSLDSLRGEIQWMHSIPAPVKRELLKFQEIREKAESKGLSTG